MECTLKIVPALVVAVLCYGHAQAQQPSENVSAVERQILIEFFAATSGERWTNRDGWATSTPVCNWYGVFCDFVDDDPNRPFVAGLSLALNNLAGQVPTSLADPPRLRSLNVTSNRLSGTVPEPFLQRWDDHQFEFSGEANSFSDVVVRASVEYSASGALCAEHDDLRFRLDLDAATYRAVFQSVRCADAKSRRTYCFVREGTPGSFARLSRELKRLGFARFESKYDYPFSGVLALLQPTSGYMRLVKDRILHVWKQRRAEARDRTAEQEKRVQVTQQKLDRLDEAFLFAQSIDAKSYERQRDRLREELTFAHIDHHAEAVDGLDLQGILAFAERILPRASDLWVQASHDYKQRPQQLFFPEGIAYDGNRFNRTAATAPLFNYLAPDQSAEESVVSRGGIEPPTRRLRAASKNRKRKKSE
jgi:Leucine rich repeat N-terminal domain